jgi:hypothetical protein
MMGTFRVRVLWGFVALLLFTSPGWAITNCFDYVAYRLNETCQERMNRSGKPVFRMGYEEMKTILNELHYGHYNALNMSLIEVENDLKPGDVIIINHDHVAIVNERFLIDHFLQVFGDKMKNNVNSDNIYTPRTLPGPTSNPVSGTLGGLFKDESYEELLKHRKAVRELESLEVWVRPKDANPYKDCPDMRDVSGPVQPPAPEKNGLSGIYQTVHTHVGCTKSNNDCKDGKPYHLRCTFTKRSDGKIQVDLDPPSITLVGELYGTNYKFTYNGYGQGTFHFSPDFSSFTGTFKDNNGHRGTWTGNKL